MEHVVVDTDILINHVRGTMRDLSDALLEQEAKRVRLVLPSVVIFEFYSGTSLNDPSVFGTAELLLSQFTVQELTEQIAKIAAELNRHNTLYQKIGIADILIAATALALGARLLTTNRRHFSLISGVNYYETKT